MQQFHQEEQVRSDGDSGIKQMRHRTQVRLLSCTFIVMYVYCHVRLLSCTFIVMHVYCHVRLLYVYTGMFPVGTPALGH